ncbi:MAG: primosomal protein N' [Cyanobacteriota bacterium]|nr:primosomal protein N' [Cyanobacteriota bacterium]
MGPPWLDIWLEAGRDGRVFTYRNPEGLSIGIGDLLQVRLQGRRHSGLVVGLPAACPEGLNPERLLPIERVLQPAAVAPQWRALIEAVANRCHTSAFQTLRTALPPGWLGQRGARGLTRTRSRFRLVLRAESQIQLPRLGERQKALLSLLNQHGGAIELEKLSGLGFSGSVLRSLERRELVHRECIEELPVEAGIRAMGPGRRLTPDQAVAVQAVNAAAPGASLLLWGVTGAGKSEVYLQAAAHTLAEGFSVLLLTPEIGLVPQLLDRCRERFGAGVLEWHSGVGPAERIRCWRHCLQAGVAGSPQLVVGTRSAVFLPLTPLGLIVLDEEHDSSYKQESPMPCYHARDVAQLRANLDGTRVLLGTATPSLESWLACEQGRVRLLRLPERIARRPLPAVRIVDMRHELAEGHRRLLSRALMSRLEGLRQQGEQAVVLVPRRGYRAFLGCRSCGQAVHCPHCDVALTVHRHAGGNEWLRCHWCDHREAMATRCGHCGSTAFKPFGAGTQRVIEQLAHELEGLRLLRFDRDTTRGRDGHRRLLERFAAGEADVLVGTQMLAKGMDLPKVTLAAVLAADGLLHRPDLRAGEQCLQLLLQLAGRAGRGERPGEVLVQTYAPDHPVIRHLVDGRYERFLEEELTMRRQAGLVPFSRAFLLRFSGPSAAGTATAATALAERLRPLVAAAGWVQIGPAPAPISRVAGRSRWQLLLHGPATQPLPLPSEAVLREGLPSGVGLAIDPDPLEL